MRRRVYPEWLAEQDLLGHIDYLARERPEAASRFVDAIEKAFDQLADMPEIGAPRSFNHPRLKNVRLWHVPNFRKYLIFYQLAHDEIRVLRVLYGSRDIQALMEEMDD